MSDTTTETPPVEPEGSEDDRITKLESKVDRILDMLSGGGKPPETESQDEPEADPKAEMRAELAKLQAAEKRKAAARDMREKNEARLAAIEQKLTEKPPREHKRSTQFMRWENDEKDRQ